MSSKNVWETGAWNALKEHVGDIRQLHLRDLLQDRERCESLVAEYDNIFMDFSRQLATSKTMPLLYNLAEAANLKEKIQAMATGKHINVTEDRAVKHMSLRAPKGQEDIIDGKDVNPDVHKVLDRIREFSEKVRSGAHVGVTGKKLTNVVSIGIGGSYLGVEFVYEAIRNESTATEASKGRKIRFLANVDPVDVTRSLEGLDPEETLVVIISKTFTTAETMLNANSVRAWLLKHLSSHASKEDIIAKHMAAVSSAVPLVTKYGINEENIFGFWDWVGGRFSVTSAVGIMPLSLHFGYPIMEEFLKGAHSMDKHFTTAPFEKNLPVLMGLLGVWNASFLGFSARALLPYAQALSKLPAHVQQVSMESNGKRVTVDGEVVPFDTGVVEFGEAGTNGQHSFYQLIHQGRTIPCDFIGFAKSQTPIVVDGEPVSNHDELMSNFFAQPDALACGKTPEELTAEGVPSHLISHKTFPGNRPSLSLLLPQLDAYTTGQLTALYEHRTAVEGFIWNVPSFDQWGVELGKVLAKRIRSHFSSKADAATGEFNYSTERLLKRYRQ